MDEIKQMYLKSGSLLKIAVGLFLVFASIVILFPELLNYQIGGWYTWLHALMEFISATLVISLGLYILLNRRIIGTNQNIFLSVIFLVSGILDIFHALSFGGMPQTIIFPSLSTSYYFWLVARIVVAGGLLIWISKIIGSQKSNKHAVFISILSSLLISGCVYLLVSFFNASLPVLIGIFGSELPKIVFEYIIILALALIGILNWRKKINPFSDYLAGFLLLAVLSEIYNIFTPLNFDLWGLFSHVFKVLAYILLYLAFHNYFKKSLAIVK